MAWFKMRRWVALGIVAAGYASACGGRANLASGSDDSDDSGGQSVGGTAPTTGAVHSIPVAGVSSFGGAITVGGSVAIGGGISIGGGVSTGGTISAGGTISIGGRVGVGGTTGVGGAPAVCKQGQVQCDAVGRFAQACARDGRGFTNQIDCGALGQRCESGVCRSLVCQPNQPACNGTVATTCNANGSGYLPRGIDCENQLDRQCVQGACLCPPNQADCDGAGKNGCEAKLLTDPNNCAGCGVVCSANHIKPACQAGQCGGGCESGFDDCNADKQADGCETNIQTDAQNCGACDSACPDGFSCRAGKCDGQGTLTFSGIAQDLAVASLTGWTQCYAETYGQAVTKISDIKAACTGSLLMMACRAVGATNLQLAAYAPREDVLFDTGLGNEPHNSNGVGWYFNGSQSWGFAPQGDSITRNSCDTQDSSIDANGVDGDQRLCWHTGGDYLQGGWRCGYNDVLNGSFVYERLLFQAP